MASVIILYWRDGTVRVFVAIALACLVAAQVVFWTLTFPANAATDNWIEQVANWQSLRAQWEYSHLGGAVFQLGAMKALIGAALARGRLALRHPRSTRIR
jgi:hypothetical protein